MNANRFERLKEILLKAADLPEGERAAYLDEACRADPDLRKEAESILAHEVDASAILQIRGARGRDAPDPLPTGDEAETVAPAASPGQTLGPYVLRECIGSGGMGEVWRAEQTSPVRRTVASTPWTGRSSVFEPMDHLKTTDLDSWRFLRAGEGRFNCLMVLGSVFKAMGWAGLEGDSRTQWSRVPVLR